MPNTRKPRARQPAAPAPPPAAAEKSAAERLAALEARVHVMGNNQQTRIATEALVAKTTPAPAGDSPAWLKVGGQMVAMTVGLLVIFGTIGGFVMAPMIGRIAALEAWRVEVAPLSTRLTTLENSVSTAGRIRDQQQQQIGERLAALERTDQSQQQQTQQIISTLATVTAQLSEVVRRLDRWEGALSRKGSDEAPAHFPMPNRGT